MKWISNGVYELLWMRDKFWCSAFGKGTQPFDFIKRNEIQKFPNEVKYIRHEYKDQQIKHVKVKKTANWLAKSILGS